MQLKEYKFYAVTIAFSYQSAWRFLFYLICFDKVVWVFAPTGSLSAMLYL
jgi:hypothetical protein